MSNRLEGKIALVTGAARGIGEAVARMFVGEGARVVLTDICDEAGAALVGQLGGDSRYRRLDVREESDWSEAMTELLDREGRLDVLVNNAAITGFENAIAPQDPEHATLSDWRSVHATNLDGVFLGCRAAIGVMRKTGQGSIINIASRSGQVGIPGAVAYASSKAAVRNHTRSVALYCAEQGLSIRCNSISPAAILTPMWEQMLGNGPDREMRMAEFVADCPVKRFGQPEEVAALAVLLASDEACYMTGSELVIDGGTLAGTASPRTDLVSD
ncbi:MAG: SDR family oxidoreductase [Wenzhouxiangella sp.]|jgi:NAD(P)-dependent dehydrogenase (short-subunit alcohol dehydrogenase family)|nr:SDR family oxidoreductase [Wenzhouxiangella sp.]